MSDRSFLYTSTAPGQSQQAVKEAYAELQQRPDARLLVRVVCHDKLIGSVWDLGPERALVVAKTDRYRAQIVGGGKPARPSTERYDHMEAALVETPGLVACPPTRCAVGRHQVMVSTSDVLPLVRDQRAVPGAQPRILKIALHIGQYAIGVPVPN